MSTVLVSGAQAHVAQVVAALHARGAAATPVVDLAEVPAVCLAAGPAAFDSYVQLPATFQVQGDTAVQRVHHFYAAGVLARFTALDAALPSLRRSCRITFVLGQLPPEAQTSDDMAARRALTRVLAHAASADVSDGRLTVRVLDAGCLPDDVAFVALGGDLAKQELMERLSSLSYADWRIELLGLASVET